MKTQKKYLIIIIAFSILAVLCGTIAALWFFTDIFSFLKPTDEVSSTQLQKVLNIESAKFTDYSDFLKDYKDMSNKSYKSKINLTAKINSSELTSNELNIINNSNFVFESGYDATNNNSQRKLGIYSNNSEVLTVDLVDNKDKVGIGCKDISDKYIVLSLEDLIKYYKNNSHTSTISNDEIKALEALSSNLSSGSNLSTYDLLYISDEDLKHFEDKYKEILNTLISKDCSSTEKNVKVNVDGKKVETTGYYLTLTGEETYKFVEDLSNLITNDDVLVRICTEKINMLLESSGQEKIDEKTVKNSMHEVFDSFLESFESIKDEKNEAIQLAFYSKDDKLVRMNINAVPDINDKDDTTILASVECSDNSTIFTIYDNGKAHIVLKNEYSEKSDDTTVGKLTLTISGISCGTLDYEFVKNDSENKLNLSLNAPILNLSAKINLQSKGDYRKEPVDVNGAIKLQFQKESIELNFDGKVEYGDVSVPELTSTNSINILDLNDNGQKTELNKFLKKASEVLPERLKLIGIDIKAEDIYTDDVIE